MISLDVLVPKHQGQRGAERNLGTVRMDPFHLVRPETSAGLLNASLIIHDSYNTHTLPTHK